MNILQVISKLDSSDAADDVIVSTRFLALNGHKIVVASPKSELVKKIDEVGARHYALGVPANIFLIPAAIFKLSQIIRKEDIRIVHARCPASALISFFASRITERTFVSTVYGFCGRGLGSRAQFWAKRVICSCESFARYFMEKGLIHRGKIRVIPPFAGTQEFNSMKNPSFHCVSGKSTPLSTDAVERGKYFDIGVNLPLTSQEAAENFVKTISIISRTIYNMRVFLINSALTSQKRELEKFRLLVRRYSLEGVVTLLPGEKVSESISGLDLFMHFNADAYTSPKLFLRAWAGGVPVFTTRAEWIKDYARDNKKAFLISGEEPGEAAKAIIGLYRNENLKSDIKNESEKLLKQEYGTKSIMESTLDLYEEASSSMNILVIKIGALGDVILAVPSLRAIRKKFPKAKIKVLLGVENRGVLANLNFIDDIIICDFKGRDASPAGFLRVLKKLHAENFDISIDFQNNKKSHMLAFMACVPKRYGYDNGKMSFLLNRKIRDSGFPVDPVEHQLKVLNLLGIYRMDKRPEICLSKEDQEWADNFLKSHWVKDGQKIIAISLGASAGWNTKLWPAEYFAEVCNKLALNFGIRVLLTGLEKERPLANKFLARARCKPIDAIGRTNILYFAALVKRCDLVLCVDSAPLHVAAGVGTPFVALFGPTDPKRHLPPFEKKHVVLRKKFKCGPCYHSRCAKRNSCMKAIKPEEVYEEIAVLMGLKEK